MRPLFSKKASSPQIIVLTAPSGSGKSTIKNYLLQEFEQLGFSISATTREKRKSEVNGKDYYFISEQEFKKIINEDGFIEYEEVYPGKFYGTLESEVKRLHNKEKVIVLDIDVQGALRVKRKYQNDAYCIFVMPPSIHELERRLNKRKSETLNSMQRRLEKARLEMEYSNKFDVILVNDILEVAFAEVKLLVNSFLAQLANPYQ